MIDLTWSEKSEDNINSIKEFSNFVEKSKEFQHKINDNIKLTIEDKKEYNYLLKKCNEIIISNSDSFFNFNEINRSILFNQPFPLSEEELYENNFDLTDFFSSFNTLGLDNIEKKQISIIFSATIDYIKHLFLQQYNYYSNKLHNFRFYIVTPSKHEYDLISDFMKNNKIENTTVIMIEYKYNNVSPLTMIMNIRFYFLTYLLVNNLSEKSILSDLDNLPFDKCLEYLNIYETVNLKCTSNVTEPLRIAHGSFSAYKLNKKTTGLMKKYCNIHKIIINTYNSSVSIRNWYIDQITLGDILLFGNLNTKYIYFHTDNIKTFNGPIEERGDKLKKYIKENL